jgi:hypothetical protein
MKTINPKLKIILTVSPVPLTATNSGKHVLIATMQSKSILRAVAGQLSDEYSYIDYFPSYEIINSAVFKGVFFEPNQRNVNPHGVSFVMDHFFNGINFIKKEDSDLLPMDENCLESFLEFYSKN